MDNNSQFLHNEHKFHRLSFINTACDVHRKGDIMTNAMYDLLHVVDIIAQCVLSGSIMMYVIYHIIKK